MGRLITEGYGEFSRRLHERAVASRVPVSATIDVTWRCPLRCAHCYNNLPIGDGDARRRELSSAQHRRLVDDLAGAGGLFLLYTGGEVFARPDFPGIYSYAKSKGFLVTLFTNGTMITPRIADLLAERRPFAVEITLYGMTKATYERLTGVRGSYERCMRGIDLLLARGLPLRLKAVALSTNRHELRDMKRFAVENLGVSFRLDALINPRLDRSRRPLALRLSPREVLEIDLEDPERTAEWKTLARRFVRPPTDEQAHRLYRCGGGLDALAVDPYGRMSICLLSHRETYDLRRGTFRAGWEEFLPAVRRSRITRTTKGTRCQLKPLCGMCAANGELEAGDREGCIDFLCRVAHLRAHVFGEGVPPHGECGYCEGGARYDALMGELAELTGSRARVVRNRAPARGRRQGPPAATDLRTEACALREA